MAFDAGQADAKITIEELKTELAIKDKALGLACIQIGGHCPKEPHRIDCSKYEDCPECQTVYFIAKAREETTK